MPNPDPALRRRRIRRPPRRRPAPRWRRRGSSCLIVTDPSNMHWLTGYDGWSFYVHQAVRRAARRRPDLVRPRPGRRRRQAHRLAARRRHRRLSRPLRAVDRAPPDGLSRRRARRARARQAPRSASRWTTTGSPPPPSPRCSGTCRTPASPTRPASSTGSARSRARPRSTTCARPPASSRRCTPASPRSSEPGMRKCDLVAEILAAGTRGVDGLRRRLSGDRAAAALRRRRLGAAPHLGRQADAGGRGHLLRDRRLLPPLPLPAVAHGLPRQADRRHSSTPRRRPSKAWRRASPPPSPATPARTSPRPSSPSSQAHGIVKDNRTGYSIGLSYPPDWGERTMSLRPGDRTELKPGMTFHFMTGLWLETMGLEITEIDPDHRDRRRMPRQRPPQADRRSTDMTACRPRRSPRRSTSTPPARSTASCACPTAATTAPGAR